MKARHGKEQPESTAGDLEQLHSTEESLSKSRCMQRHNRYTTQTTLMLRPVRKHDQREHKAEAGSETHHSIFVISIPSITISYSGLISLSLVTISTIFSIT